MSKIAIGALMLASVVLSTAAQAETTAVDFSATVSQDKAGLSPVGSVVTGHYELNRDPSTYTAAPTPQWLLLGSAGTDYFYTDPYGATRVNYATGSPDVSGGLRAIQVTDNLRFLDGTTWDSVGFMQRSKGVSYYLTLFGPDTSFTGTAFPGDNWFATGWSMGSFRIESELTGQTMLYSDVTNLSVHTVPEPASALLMLAGISGLWVAARRRRRHEAPVTASA